MDAPAAARVLYLTTKYTGSAGRLMQLCASSHIAAKRRASRSRASISYFPNMSFFSSRSRSSSFARFKCEDELLVLDDDEAEPIFIAESFIAVIVDLPSSRSPSSTAKSLLIFKPIASSPLLELVELTAYSGEIWACIAGVHCYLSTAAIPSQS